MVHCLRRGLAPISRRPAMVARLAPVSLDHQPGTSTSRCLAGSRYLDRAGKAVASGSTFRRPPLPLRDARIGALRLPEATGASVRLGRPRTFRVAFANRPGASGWSVTSDPENPIGRALPACRSRGRTAHRPVNHILRYRSDGVVELCALAQQRRVRTSAAGRRTERPRRDGLQDRPLRYRDRETLAGPDCSTSLGGP